MFKIKPIQDLALQKCFAKKCGCEAKIGYFAYGMSDCETDAPMGFSQFEIESDESTLTDLRPAIGYDDFEAMFILGRQTLNFIDKCGSHKCKAYSTTADKQLLTSIGFKTEDEENYYCDMTGMFDGHCDNK